MIVGLLGKETSEGLFDVHEICYPGIPEQLPLPKRGKISEEGYIYGSDNRDYRKRQVHCLGFWAGSRLQGFI